MNTVLWVLQIVLGLMFTVAGLLKVIRSRKELAPQMGWVEDFSDGQVKTIGTLEILAGIGLVLPAWTGIAPVLTPLAALGLVIVMIGAAVVHGRRGEYPRIAANVVLLALAAVVVWGRFGPYAY